MKARIARVLRRVADKLDSPQVQPCLIATPYTTSSTSATNFTIKFH